jgi:hypothetical protein
MLERRAARTGHCVAKTETKERKTMKNWFPKVYKLANPNTVRLIWILLVVTALVLGSGAPLAFGGGSGAGH